jgi:membrane protein
VTLLSIAALLFGATGAFAQVQAALNKAWNIEPATEGGGLSGLLTKRVLSFGMILIIVFLLIVSLVVSAALSAAGSSIAGFLPAGIGSATLALVDIVLSLGVITILFMTIYKVLPDAEIAWRDVSVGAFATAVLFVIGKFLLGFYIGHSNPGSAFGAAGSLAVILVWIYYSAMVFFLGAEFTQSWADRRGQGIRPDSEPDPVQVQRHTAA